MDSAGQNVIFPKSPSRRADGKAVGNGNSVGGVSRSDEVDSLTSLRSTTESVSAQGENAEEEEEVPIDDDEFNIPPVDFEPTLESILNDVDDQSISDDEGHGHQISTQPQVQVSAPIQIGLLPEASDTVSIVSKGSDSRSRSSSRSVRLRPGQILKKKPNSILRHVLLKGMTSHINTVSDNVDAGTATAVAIGSLIAVGTSHGYILIFDAMQSFKWCLGDANSREAGGSVSSLAVSGNGSRLLVGYAKGLISMYDLENGRLIRTLYDVHAINSAVLILRFTDEASLALCSDSGGSVFELNFKRTMGVRGCESRCIFSGSRGEVCTFEPLLLSSYPDNALSKYVIIALATLSKVIVVTIRPKLRVLFTHALSCDPTTLPLVSWQMVIIQTTQNEKVVDPVLTFARDSNVYFYQVTQGPKGTPQFLPLQKFSVNYQLVSLHWLNSRILALLDTREHLRIMDVRSQEELEKVDLTQARLVYASSHFKGLATGGNVSQAFALAGERACYNSILCFNNQMVVLGTKSVHALTMRTWHERLDYLVRQNYYTEALQLGYELYLEKAKAVIGLKGSKDSKRLIVREKILYILENFVDRISTLNYMDDLSTAKQNYAETISTAIKYYVLLDNVEPIFDKLYEICIANPVSKAAYLESLESYILNDQLRAIPPTVVKDFVTHYEELGNFKPLEACIVHLNVESLDIHQTMKLCWTQGLYDAIIYIYNQGMQDFISPLEELMTELQAAVSTEAKLTDAQVALGHKILVYLSCCLAGRAYPYGNIQPNLVEKVQSDIFRCITTLHTRNSTDNELAYPYLRCFLKFDTREFLNVLSLSFEEPIFQLDMGKRQKQRMVDILLQVMVEQGNFTPTQVGVLFTFLARQMARPDNSLYVSKLLFEQVLEHLTSGKDASRVDERQQALLELLQAGGMQHFEPQKLLEKCIHAKFYRVCEMLYERKQEYDKIIECYLFDESRHQQVFSYLHKIFCLFPNKKEEFQKQIKQHLEALVEIDNKKAAQVIYLHLASLVQELVRSLEKKPEKQYLFIQGIFAMSRDQNQGGISVDTLTTERYIELLCRYNSQLVYPFLTSVESYRHDKALEICHKYNLIEAIGYLLEKDGKVLQAFDLMLSQFKDKLSSVFAEVDGLLKSKDKDSTVFTSMLQWNQLQALFFVMIQFSQRNSPKLITEDREKLWLPLLELTISAHNKYPHEPEVSSSFNEMTKHLLSSMMGHVSLPTIVEIVMNDPSYQKATFAEIRDLVMGMLETCTYEDMMVTLVKRVTESDLHDILKNHVKCLKQGFSSKNKACQICRQSVVSECTTAATDSVVLFQCGHSYHYSCCERDGITSCILCHVSDPHSSQSRSRDISFNAPNVFHQYRQRTTSGSLLEDDNQEEIISHAEFELKLDASCKVELEDF
ncbi:unnamed protein product [Orchesella dallaii]|uniref:RING-type domain-containing protein n=1 Tax=Orchesella dallaii TaxID=48710 RepID=A0ABP1QFW1_9HEXA